MMRSNESASSVFYHSQEEEPGKTGSAGHSAARDILSTGMFDAHQSTMSESSPGMVEQDGIGNNLQLSNVSSKCSKTPTYLVNVATSMNEI